MSRITPRTSPLARLAPLLVLASLLAIPGVADAGRPGTRAVDAGATTAIHRALARRGVSTPATIAARVTATSRRVGSRTEVSCEVRVVVAATNDGHFRGSTTATVKGHGRYAKRGVDAERAKTNCAELVAEELAITHITPFLSGLP